MNTRRSAAAALTAMALELVLLRPVALKVIVMFVATLCERLVKVTRPLTAVRLVMPCKAPLPVPRAAEAASRDRLAGKDQ